MHLSRVAGELALMESSAGKIDVDPAAEALGGPGGEGLRASPGETSGILGHRMKTAEFRRHQIQRFGRRPPDAGDPNSS